MDRRFASLRKTLAANARRARQALRISQEELAHRADIDRTYISQIERGISNPSLFIMHKVSTALDTTVVQLLERRPR